MYLGNLRVESSLWNQMCGPCGEKVSGEAPRMRTGDAARHTLFITGSPEAPPGTSSLEFFMGVVFLLSGRSCCQSCGRTNNHRAVEERRNLSLSASLLVTCY